MFVLAGSASLPQFKMVHRLSTQVEQEEVSDGLLAIIDKRVVRGGSMIVAVAGVQIKVLKLWKCGKWIAARRMHFLL